MQLSLKDPNADVEDNSFIWIVRPLVYILLKLSLRIVESNHFELRFSLAAHRVAATL